MLLHLTLTALTLFVQAPARQTFFTTPYSLDEMRGKQAVLETTEGQIVITLLPESAPNHVGLFMKLSRDGAYNGTIFHSVVANAVIQGGDPLSRDPTRAARYGSGGLNQLRAESKLEKMTAGAVAAVLLPGMPDSAGSQFFICIGDQPGLEGQYTVFGRVEEGLEVAQRISNTPADASKPLSRIAIRSVTIRDAPPVPFVNDTPAELATYRATLETTMGSIGLEVLPDKAPETVRSFLRMATAGVYDGIKVHRVSPNFVIQTGSLAYRETPLLASQQRLVGNLPPEFSDTPNVPGIVSIARGDDPNSGSTSFFICTGSCRALDGKYTVFARVVSGMEVVQAIAAVPIDGETPRSPISLTRVRVEKNP